MLDWYKCTEMLIRVIRVAENENECPQKGKKIFLCQTAKNKMAAIPLKENLKTCIIIAVFNISKSVIPQNDASVTNKLF